MIRDVVYLHGIRDPAGVATPRVRTFLGLFVEGDDATAERAAFAAAMDVFRQHRDALIVHYSLHERTKYRELQRRFPDVCTAEERSRRWFAPDRAVDLYAAAKKSIWPTPDNSIKSLAPFCGFEWRDDNASGAASFEWFHRYVTEGDPAVKQRILDYNEDDCRAMRFVLDRMRRMQTRAL